MCVCCVPLTRTEQDTHTGGGGDGGVGHATTAAIQLQITICVKVVKEDTGEEYSLVAGMEGAQAERNEPLTVMNMHMQYSLVSAVLQ